MLRTSIKSSLGRLARMSSPHRPVPRKELKQHQSSYSGGGGRGGGGVWLVVGTLTVATAGTAVYAKYDPSFRKLLEDNVPYSDSVLSVTSDLIDQVNGLIGTAQDTTSNLLQSAKDKVSSEPEPVPKAKLPVTPKKEESKTTPTIQPVVPAPDDSLVKKKQEREVQAAAARTLNDLKSALDEISIAAVAAHNQASQHIRGLGDELSHYASTEPNEKVLAGLIAKNLNADHLTKKAAEASAEAKFQVGALKAVLAACALPHNSDGVRAAEQSIAGAEAKLHDAEKNLLQAQSTLKHSQALQKQVAQAYNKLEQELGPGWDGGKADNQDLFVLLVALRMVNYKDQLAKHTEVNERALMESLAAAGQEGVEERVQNHLAAKEEELKQLLSQEYQIQLVKVREESERRAQVQLHQQAVVLSEDKNAALQSQKAAFTRELTERMGQQTLQHTQQVGEAIDKLKTANENITKRESEIHHGAELLAMSRSCDTLARSLSINPFPALDWTHQKRAIDAHIRDIKHAFSGANEDEFVKTTLAMIPQAVVSRGVFTEPSLKSRFHNVERVARKVGMIRESDNVSLSTYLLSYLRSTVLMQPVSPIKDQELDNAPMDLADLDNNAILDRARYFVDQGDLMQAIRYMNLLQGPAQYIASGWVEEARLLLEVQHVANTLSSYASLLVQHRAIGPELTKPSVIESKS